MTGGIGMAMFRFFCSRGLLGPGEVAYSSGTGRPASR
jgi:hypothetical protein